MVVEYVLDISPSTWVRMTAKSKFKPSAIAYYDWKGDVASLAKQQGLKGLKSFYEVDFYCQMPKSWSKKKREEMEGKPKQVTPDWDNYAKALQDALAKEDGYIYGCCACKYWSTKPRIVIRQNEYL